jgi:hypothetical protein
MNYFMTAFVANIKLMHGLLASWPQLAAAPLALMPVGSWFFQPPDRSLRDRFWRSAGALGLSLKCFQFEERFPVKPVLKYSACTCEGGAAGSNHTAHQAHTESRKGDRT